MAKKIVPVEETKWFQRGFGSKHEYIGWLQFNDRVEESVGWDDTWHDPYLGKTIRIGEQATEDVSKYEPAAPKTTTAQ